VKTLACTDIYRPNSAAASAAAPAPAGWKKFRKKKQK
jgi:hypothetical protein